MCENVKNYCRICLDVESVHVPIFGDNAIHLHMKSCLAVNVSPTDGLPTDICISCVSQLNDFYNFKLNAMFSQEWLESCIQENTKKSETKTQPILPLPDCEYNSDSLLEFLNNTANIDEYLNNLGREDIPSIVNMLDRNNENSMEAINKAAKGLRIPVSPKKIPSKGKGKGKKEVKTPSKSETCNINMEIDVLDSDIDIVHEILMREMEPRNQCSKGGKIPLNGKLLNGKILNDESIEKLHPTPVKNQHNVEKHTTSGKNVSNINNTENKQGKHQTEIVVKRLENVNTLPDSPNKREIRTPSKPKTLINTEVDVLNSDVDIVNVIRMKDVEPRNLCHKIDKTPFPLNGKIRNGKIINNVKNIKKLHPRPRNSHHNDEKDTTSEKTVMNLDKAVNKQEKPQNKIIIKRLEKANTCFACKLTCEDPQKLSHHLSTCDFAQRMCKQCGTLFDSKHQMLKHSIIHVTGKLYKCVCGKEFRSKEYLLHHQNVCQFDFNTDVLGLMYRCKQCELTFYERSLMYKHVKEHILKADKRICDICGRAFYGDEGLKKHRNELHGKTDTEGLLYRCKVCSHTSPSHKELYDHVRQHLETDSDRLLCDTCGEAFKTGAMLLEHSLLHGKQNTKERDDMYESSKIDKDHKKCSNSIDKTEHSNGIKRPYSALHIATPDGNKVPKKCLNGIKKVESRNGIKRPYSASQIASPDGNQCNTYDKLFEDVKGRDEHVVQQIDMTVCEKCGMCIVTSHETDRHMCA